ncbi:uncharacterized protein GIQ15_05654 [Arthroderma uncinatum]|uniref:uncharacterized protein n=1 Tax=Arthroderma uncinatum TaxID=74035 RepID=UPI00144A9BBC|nr:uncharacterized protein GIQ15_05654 [Arthroderma uncinatum]KAF3480307.1 hypothetical protein GIQ15_05654 [Arthroderma uncinatum]
MDLVLEYATDLLAQWTTVSLRQATYIVPSTGQRVHGVPNPAAEFENDNERTPLLQPDRCTEDGGWWYPGWLQRAAATTDSVRTFIQSETGKGILKCSLAYLLGTMATFVPVLSQFLGQQGGKHTVATVTVYFHPARTKGSMIEALMLAMIAFCYAAFITITSMSVSVLFEDVFHLLPLGHAIILIVFCGGGLGFIGWVKQRRGNPLVNVACSLASLAIITVLTKEGAVQRGDLSLAKIYQVFKMIIMGVIATMTVCFVVYPISAKRKLRQTMVEMTDSLSDMLEIITEGFIYGGSGTESRLEQGPFLDASNRNKAAYSKMEKLLREAKLEHYVAGTEKEYQLEQKLVRCIQDISQSIGGLRSAAALQSDILKQFQQPPRERSSFDTLRSPRNHSPPPSLNRSGLTSSRSDDIQSPTNFGTIAATDYPRTGNNSTDFVQAPAEIFERFIIHLGLSMNSLAYTLREILRELPYGPAPDFKVTVNSKFRTSLDRALELYRSSRNDALTLIYNQKDLIMTGGKPLGVEADLEEVAASCGHFSFSLQEFGEQLKEFLGILDKLQLEAEERPNGRSWRWLIPWASESGADDDLAPLDTAKADVVSLAVFGWAMSLWTAYIILAQGKGPMGRFIMLTYNLTVLYAYSLSQEGGDNDVDEGGENPVIADIALHRVVAVFSGILWGIIITRIIWPSSAKRKLKDGLSVLWLRMSVIWKRDPLSTMIRGGPTTLYFDVQEKIQLQLFLSHLDSLLVSARSEFSLKRPFPDAEYGALVARSRRLLDAFQAMNLEIMKNLTASEAAVDILGTTLTFLKVLASSMKLGYALNEVLPDTEHARDRLLARLHHFRSDKQASQLTTDEDYALLYAYALVTAQLSTEIVVLMEGPSRPASALFTMQIDPAALTGTTDFASVVSASTTKAASVAPPITQKTTKALISVPRLDVEPIYTELKGAIGDGWTEYKQATTLFLLGHLNQNEFTARATPLLSVDPKRERLHNNFVCALLGNLSRDLPDHGVASWVSANDKPTVVSKPASGDAAEQRLKTEVMQLPPRDRRRLKAIPESDSNVIPNSLEEYQLAKQIRLPDQVPASAGGLNKTTYMAIATENFVKTFLSNVFGRTKSNGPSGTINGTTTRRYRRQLEREEMAFTRGELVRNTTNGLLPIEAKEASIRQPLGLRDLKLTLDLAPGALGHMPLVISQIMDGYLEEELEAESQCYLLEANGGVDASDQVSSGDEMDVDEEPWDWEGATAADHNQLSSILDECLSMAA